MYWTLAIRTLTDFFFLGFIIFRLPEAFKQRAESRLNASRPFSSTPPSTKLCPFLRAEAGFFNRQPTLGAPAGKGAEKTVNKR